MNLRYSFFVRILVTGGAGFIGSHLTDYLIQMEHRVVVLDNLSTGDKINLSRVSKNPNFEFVHGSILDFDILQELISKSDYVFHLAASVGVFNIVEYPLKSMLVNINGTENVLKIVNNFKIPVLLTSSSEIYGKNAKNSLSEDDDRILGNPSLLRWSYSESKAIDESLAMAYHKETGLPVRIVRLFNTVGPRQVGNYGMVIPRFIDMAIRNKPLTIFGDGSQKRSFAHVSDVVEGIERVAFNKNSIGKAVNIGNSDEISILNLAKLITEKIGSKSILKFMTYDEAYGSGFEDMERRVPNLNLIKNLTGWEPKRNLNQIIEDIISYHNKLL